MHMVGHQAVCQEAHTKSPFLARKEIQVFLSVAVGAKYLPAPHTALSEVMRISWQDHSCHSRHVHIVSHGFISVQKK